MRPLVTLREALERDDLLGRALPGDSWAAWRVILIATAGEPLHADEREVFTKLTGGRPVAPGRLVDTFLAVAGRRSGKSRAMAVLTVYLATLCDWSASLALGERGLALFMAPTEAQAAVTHRYACALIEGSPVLSALVVRRTADALELSNGIDLEVIAASWRRSRGRTAVAIVLDECAFLMSADDSLNRDTEIVVALRPSLATTGGPMLLTSSPSTFEGVTAAIFRRHHGPAGDPATVVVQSDTRELNPTLSQAVIDKAFEDDPESAGSEWGGAFRAPSAAFLTRGLVERAVTPGGRPEGTCLPGVQYFGYVDVAGGTGQDSFAAAVGHIQRDAGRDVAIIDVVFEQRPPFDPDVVTARLCAILKAWRIHEVHADHYASGWPVAQFARHGVTYRPAPLTTSAAYLHTIPLWTAARVRIPDSPRLVDQLCGLRRKVGSGGLETVTHASGAHDDLACACCGALWMMTANNSADAWIEAMGADARRLSSVAPAEPPADNRPWQHRPPPDAGPPRYSDETLTQAAELTQIYTDAYQGGTRPAAAVCGFCGAPLGARRVNVGGVAAFCSPGCSASWNASRASTARALAPPVQGRGDNPNAVTRYR